MPTQFNFLIFPYRDLYFLTKYGPIVRDLQIIESLRRRVDVKSITVVNRPVSIYERLLGKRFPSSQLATKTRYLDRTSLNLIGPLRRRKWFNDCYNEYREFPARDHECINVLLDFTPFSPIDYEAVGYDLVWYDLIDNFTKHNQYDEAEKEYVRAKYRAVQTQADLVTASSSKNASEVEGAWVVSNGVGVSRTEHPQSSSRDARYDFGFIGFITDKMDCRLIQLLSDAGYSIGIFGAFYNAAVKSRLSAIPNVYVHGPFTDSDRPAILAQFKVGLIPYLPEKLHDESPLKLYQYLYDGHPVLTSVQFDHESPYVRSYSGSDDAAVLQTCQSLLASYANEEIRRELRLSISEADFWEHKIDGVLSKIAQLHS